MIELGYDMIRYDFVNCYVKCQCEYLLWYQSTLCRISETCDNQKNFLVLDHVYKLNTL